MDDIDDVCHMANDVSVVQKMLREAGFSVCIFKVTEMFLETGFKGSSCLSGVFHIACLAGYLVYAALLVLAFGFMLFC
jgi:hypothetical protein